jgi:uncharacterized membrane protein
MNFDTAKNLGGVGALLLFVGAILFFVHPFIGGFTEFVGLILVLVALYGLSEHYKESGIFSNALFSVVAGVVGAVLVAVVAFFVLLSSFVDLLQKIFPGWNGTNWSALSGMTPETANLNPSDVLPLLLSLAVIWIVVWMFAIAVTFLFRKSLKSLAAKSGTGLFSTAGLLMLIGGVLMVVFIGLLLIWVGFLLLAIAFFQMKKQEPASADATMAPPPPTI